MTEQTMFDRELVGWLAEETLGGMPEPALAAALEATGRVRPNPTWLARLREPALRWERRTAVGTPRRRLVLVALIGLLALAALAAVAGGWRPFEPQANGDWNGYRGGPDRTGLANAGPVGRPVLHWRFAAGDSVKDAIAIAGNLVIAPSQDGVVHAIAIDDGAERWRFAPGTSVSAPFADGGRVFVVDGHGFVHALELETGRDRWVSTEKVDSVSSPIVEGGQVIIGTGDGDLVALDAETGTRRWRVNISAGAVRDPAAGSGLVIAGTVGGKLVALRSSDGSMIWSRDFGGDPLGTPTIAGSIVYSGGRSDEDGGRLRALDVASGDLIWQTDEPWFAPSLAGDLAISGRTDGLIVGRDARTGTERWRFASGGPSRGPAIYGSTVVVGVDLDNSVAALDLATGRPLWRYDVDDSNQCCVAVAKGYVVVGTMAGSIYVIGGDGSVLVPGTPDVASAPPSLSASAPVSPTPSAQSQPYTVTERLGAAVTGIHDPLGMAIGPSGDVFVTDMAMRVTRIRPDGRIERWGKSGSGEGELDFIAAAGSANPHGSLTVGPDGAVYVSDSDNHRVQVFTADGRFIRAFGSLGSDPGQFTIPFDLGVDSAGNVFVTDDGLQRLTKFDPSGKPVWIADGSTDPRLAGHLHTPRIDDEGRITLANDDSGLILVLDPNGKVIDEFEAPACGVTVDSAGQYHVPDCRGTVRLYGADHSLIGTTGGMDLITVELGPNGQIAGLDRNGDVIRFTLQQPSPSQP
jgi:outer membrane protein assembly factor BamB